ncbi:MAG: beta-ketoacyl-ACP synthase [Lamprobacter sp.]|uniref:beta-ketoacyl-ACP synthase n=1 Tax=Lamprobacter sp. TaxID=3100796 RepID=UPI002B260CFD|nr:beta-ketoacyl-ACP synthase [Lamprobacter sp.]MEA3640599.1 beta-ketoacyl-ACP synthase [Lamprobacter sp.]
MPIEPASISAYTATTAVGHGLAAHLEPLAAMRPVLRPGDMAEVSAPCWVGVVDGLDDNPLGGDLAAFDCRNNRLAALALEGDGFAEQVAAARARVGASRIGLFLGTSTSGIRHSEHCYQQHFEQGTPGLGEDLRFATTHAYVSIVDFCRRRLDLEGPALVVSTACSSGAKTFAAAHRALSAGVCDAAVVGGVDTLCATTLMGFHALGLLSPTPCAPWSQGRSGISIGEGAAFALLELKRKGDDHLALLGYGESDDAYHIASPHPEGAGAALAMRAALETADLAATDIDYVNLHGTGTPANDQSEDQAISTVFGDSVPVSATKGWTGHTLGASGAVEAVLSLLSIEAGLLPGTLNTERLDPALSAPLIRRSQYRSIDRVLSNSFGFGGNNCVLALGRT